jgi:hypothetical protein
MLLRFRDFCLGWRSWHVETRGYCAGGRMIQSGTLSFAKRFWIDVWELNPEGFGSLWLKASATCGGGNHFGWRPPWLQVGGELYPFNCLTPEESTEGRSQGSQVVLGSTRCVDLAVFQPRMACWACPLRLTVDDFREPMVASAFKLPN